jgi:hypothetical protein
MKWKSMRLMRTKKLCEKHVSFILYDEGQYYLGTWLCKGCGGPGWACDGVKKLLQDEDFQYFLEIVGPSATQEAVPPSKSALGQKDTK